MAGNHHDVIMIGSGGGRTLAYRRRPV